MCGYMCCCKFKIKTCALPNATCSDVFLRMAYLTFAQFAVAVLYMLGLGSAATLSQQYWKLSVAGILMH